MTIAEPVFFDCEALIWRAIQSTADISDSAGAQQILDAIRKRWTWIKHLFADGAYDRRKLMDKAAFVDGLRQKAFEKIGSGSV
jgi:hypothetical protein